jgi:hypothetical protein
VAGKCVAVAQKFLESAMKIHQGIGVSCKKIKSALGEGPGHVHTRAREQQQNESHAEHNFCRGQFTQQVQLQRKT